MPLPSLSTDRARDPASAKAGRDLRSRLLDMEDNMRHYLPQLVTSDDGRVYLAAAALLDGQISADLYPTGPPQNKLFPAEESWQSLDFSNRNACFRIEEKIREFGLQTVTFGEQSVLARANPVGFSLAGFQVVWIGSRRQWLVEAGTFRWTETDYVTLVSTDKSQDFPRTMLDGSHGFICLDLIVDPQPIDDRVTPFGGFVLGAGGPTLSNAFAQIPCLRAITFGGILGGSPALYQTTAWTTGFYKIPIAYVETPTHNSARVPLVQQFLKDNISLSTDRWLGSLPHPL